MIGYLRNQARELQVMESKPESKEFEDLRLNEPFPELEEFAYSMDLQSLDDQ